MTTINKRVAVTVKLGSAQYGSPLAITATGTVATGQTGAVSILVPKTVANARIGNKGNIFGGKGGSTTGNAGTAIFAQGALNLANAGLIQGGLADQASQTSEAGGAGIDLRSGGTVTNTGSIVGGVSGESNAQSPVAGGIGANLRHVALSNFGTIGGGEGGSSINAAGIGWIGVSLADGSSGLNKGHITGGSGGYYYNERAALGYAGPFASGGDGGTGVQIANSRFSNAGTIEGGRAGPNELGTGGIGVNLFSTGTLSNSGLVQGGAGGYLYDAFGTGGIPYGGAGGTGVSLHGATLVNSGTIIGGGSYAYGSSGGAGVFLEGGAVTNTGTIIGGATNKVSGDGVDVIGGTVVSTGKIIGGSYNYLTEKGGIGVSINTGTLVAGGTIIGGYGYSTGHDTRYAPNGGVGVYLNGGTVIANGAIDGSSVSLQPTQTQADAVAFGTLAGTLVIHPTATFSGQVAATAGAGDALVLAGNGGTLTGLGTQFTGFDSLTVDTNSLWSLAGTSALALDLAVTDAGHLVLETAVSGTGTITLGSGASLSAAQSVSGIGVAFNGPGHLRLAQPSGFASTITAFGAGDVVDLQRLSATSAAFANGTLTLLKGATNVGSLAFAGTFTSANFGLSSDGAGGTNIGFVASPMQADLLPNFAAGRTGPWHADQILQAGSGGSSAWHHADMLAIGHSGVHPG